MWYSSFRIYSSFDKYKEKLMASQPLPQIVFVGIIIKKEQTKVEVAFFGTGISRRVESFLCSPKTTVVKIVRHVVRKAKEHHVKVVAAGLDVPKDWEDKDSLQDTLWQLHDIVPHFVSENTMHKKWRAPALARLVSEQYEGNIAKVKLGDYRKVIPSDLLSLDYIKKHSQTRDIKELFNQAKLFRATGGSMVFLNSTPVGGGVALMRHALMRLYRLLGLDIHWHVLFPQSSVFEITKKKFHNILQAVAPKNDRLTKKDQEVYQKWIAENWKLLKTPLTRASVIVIDDPQPSGLIPYIKKANPDVKIIYRSHIQLRADLMGKRGTAQERTWKFLKPAIDQASIFVSHPIPDFLPHDVARSKVVFMPATTDLFDGLNKKITKYDRKYYFHLFNEILAKSDQPPLSSSRPYIIQIARFDPSKGIPDVIEAYRRLLKKLNDRALSSKDIPQLVIVGNGATDDPEGSLILQEVLFLLEMDRYQHLARDIKVVRLPHIDQLLNTLLSFSFCALQLSHREGFEVKVTEALHKGKPVIAYRTGGIPLQIHHGVTGYLVRTGDTKQVAQKLFNLTTNRSLYATFCKRIERMNYEQYGTVANALRWLFLANQLLSKKKFLGRGRSVDTFLKKV